MYLQSILIALCGCTVLVESVAVREETSHSSSDACKSLAKRLPNSVFFPGSSSYANDNVHFVQSSSQNSTCSVEPQTVNDVGTILKTVGSLKVPFGIKSSGHIANANFSSTSGVQISMTAFDNVSYDSTTSTVKIGTGQSWDVVYAKLESLEVTVAGGRVPGVGVGGLALGGGFSWITDQHGLTVDTMVAFDLVLPNGTFVQVNNASNPDLFFALKGGFNNFGIVTSFTMTAYPLTQIWGGGITFNTSFMNEVNSAMSNFSFNNTDSKAQMIGAYSIDGTGEVIPSSYVLSILLMRPLKSTLAVYLFYDAPTKPDAFDAFLSIPSLTQDVKVRNFTEFLLTSFGPAMHLPLREKQHAVPILKYTTSILETIEKEVDALYNQAVADAKQIENVLFSIEPFQHPFAHSTDSAYPHPSDRQVTPSTPSLLYVNADDESYFENALKGLVKAVQSVSIQEDQSRSDDLYYPNYALADTPLEQVFGSSLPRLRKIRHEIDPDNVMLLTGGFKFI
ncbi:hypothetical protein D9757_010448 [Collybiopsis confluens]|uniref:FAD-binding PCMH-type domain-containing protein n=1 Tax=Collybiopsis confluens TaxID=2823264 RepID=A0A8H5GRE1_9AGAR|nr:hypothetical protein D9757_010448 [Collybiopsis confluens]